jgi:hypothetical protein
MLSHKQQVYHLVLPKGAWQMIQALSVKIPLRVAHLTLLLNAAAILCRSTLLKGAQYCTSALVRISLREATHEKRKYTHSQSIAYDAPAPWCRSPCVQHYKHTQPQLPSYQKLCFA